MKFVYVVRATRLDFPNEGCSPGFSGNPPRTRAFRSMRLIVAESPSPAPATTFQVPASRLASLRQPTRSHVPLRVSAGV
jgi:hypothetical protein